jgi:branched-chain amino acid transport system permease protein
VAAVSSLGPFKFNSSKDLYPPLLVLVAIALLFFWILMHSKVGRGWLWMAADPNAASAFGIPIARYKIAAYGAAGAFAGFGGALMAAWVRDLSPQAFPLTLSFTFLLAAVLAGRGYAGGVLLSGLMLRGGPLFFSGVSSGVNRTLLYIGPIALILNLTMYKAGFNGAGRSLVDRLGRSTSRRLRRGRYHQGPVGPACLGAVRRSR